MEARHSGNISEMVQVKGKEKELQFELDYLREQLKKEQDKVKQYQEQVGDCNRGSYMSAHVILNSLNELGKRDKMRGLPSILSLFRNEFNKSIIQDHEC